MGSLLERLKAGKRNVRIIDFPGAADARVALRVLSTQELQDAAIATEELFKARGVEIGVGVIDAYQGERSTQILFRALRDPDDPNKPFAATVDELRGQLMRGEMDALEAAYSDFQAECSPDMAEMSAADFEKIWDELKKSPRAHMSGLSSATLRGLITFLASRQQSSPTGSGSTS